MDATTSIGSFRVDRRVRFSDCDPAGIVFYPQYFVMFNGLVEDWFDGPLGIGYQRLIAERKVGLPTVRIEADFKAVSRFGDDVVLSLDVERLGERSLTLRLACSAASDGELRMQARQVLVSTSLESHSAIALPGDIKAAITRWVSPVASKDVE